MAPTTVYRALRRHDLGTRQQHLRVLERPGAAQTGRLTEGTHRAIQRARPTAPLDVTPRLGGRRGALRVPGGWGTVLFAER